MNDPNIGAAWRLFGRLFRAHPWHGVYIGAAAPASVTTFIEIVPDDAVKFEMDKPSGYLRVDRPQQYSNISPTLYGFIPQTCSAATVAEWCRSRTGRPNIVGDGDPLDICVLTEKRVSHGDILVEAVPIGGLRVIDEDAADDKLIAVMAGDIVYGGYRDVSELPDHVIDRMKHYFLTYKQKPDAGKRQIEIEGVYDADEAREVIRRGQRDYTAAFAAIQSLLTSASSA